MRDIQLPLIAPTLFFLIVINLTDSFTDSFGIVDIMTQGGPARATDLMVYKIYFDGFKGLDYSRRRRAEHHPDAAGHRADLRPVPLRRAPHPLQVRARPMVERTPVLDIFTQVILFLGLLVALAPLRDRRHRGDATICSTVNQVPMPLVPGHDFLENVAEAWQTGRSRPRSIVNS